MSSRLFSTLVLFALLPLAAAAQAPQAPLVIRSMTGKDLFRFYCAPCHGADARGSGPAASALKTAPADLTKIAARRNGRFPRAEVISLLATGDGAAVAAHGSAEMPVWGPIFRGLDTSNVRTDMRIDNLVTYLESVQVR